MKYSYQTSSSSSAPTPEKSEADKSRERIQALNSSISSYCYNYSSTIEDAGKKVVQDFMKTVAKSKTMVDAVIDSVYSKEKERIANEISQTARSVSFTVSSGILWTFKQAEISERRKLWELRLVSALIRRRLVLMSE